MRQRIGWWQVRRPPLCRSPRTPKSLLTAASTAGSWDGQVALVLGYVLSWQRELAGLRSLSHGANSEQISKRGDSGSECPACTGSREAYVVETVRWGPVTAGAFVSSSYCWARWSSGVGDHLTARSWAERQHRTLAAEAEAHSSAAAEMLQEKGPLAVQRERPLSWPDYFYTTFSLDPDGWRSHTPWSSTTCSRRGWQHGGHAGSTARRPPSSTHDPSPTLHHQPD